MDILAFFNDAHEPIVSAGQWGEELILPHPYAHQRAFVLLPWMDLPSAREPWCILPTETESKPWLNGWRPWILQKLPAWCQRQTGCGEQRGVAIEKGVATARSKVGECEGATEDQDQPVGVGRRNCGSHRGCECSELLWKFPTHQVDQCGLAVRNGGCCMGGSWHGEKRIADGGVGFDRSQMQPTTVASWMLYGKALAWIGALLSGIYVGLGVYVVPHAGQLAAAQADVPGIVAGIVGALASAVAGVRLERACEAPPADGACGSAKTTA